LEYDGNTSYMEVTNDMSTSVYEAYLFDNDSGTFNPGSELLGTTPADGVITFYGECSTLDVCAGPYGLTAENITAEEATINWEIDNEPDNGFSIKIFETADDPN